MDDLFLDNRAAVLPSVRYIGIVRHSARLDDAPNDDLSLLVDDREQRRCWTDRLERPYDPPIVDFDLPRRAAKEIKW